MVMLLPLLLLNYSIAATSTTGKRVLTSPLDWVGAFLTSLDQVDFYLFSVFGFVQFPFKFDVLGSFHKSILYLGLIILEGSPRCPPLHRLIDGFILVMNVSDILFFCKELLLSDGFFFFFFIMLMHAL